jgi:hypothetical protein
MAVKPLLFHAAGTDPNQVDLFSMKKLLREIFPEIQGGSNMTGTICV